MTSLAIRDSLATLKNPMGSCHQAGTFLAPLPDWATDPVVDRV